MSIKRHGRHELQLEVLEKLGNLSLWFLPSQPMLPGPTYVVDFQGSEIATYESRYTICSEHHNVRFRGIENQQLAHPVEA